MSSSAIPAWDGPLPVADLAMDAVGAVARATAWAAEARGIDLRVATSAALVEAAFGTIDHLRVDGRQVDAWAPVSGFFAASDGWVRLHGNYPHHAAAITAALGASTKDQVTAAISALGAEETVERVLAAGGIAAAVRTPEQWAAHPHARAVVDDPWIAVAPGTAASSWRPARAGAQTSATVPAVLEGLRVLDLTRVVAGPVCTQLLACLGADVLRLDPPERPELLDAHLAAGMGKRSAALDLRAHRDRLEELLAGADVVVLGYRPGALADVGLDPDALAARHPHLVVGALSAWGDHGPWGDRAGFDSIVQAATGIAARCAREDGRPGALPVQALDHATGHRLASGILDLLAEGRAGVVRASLLGAARTLLDPASSAAPASAVDDDAATTVELDTPHGHVVTVPVPLLLDGAPLTGPITGYGAAEPRWSTDRG